MTRFLEHVFPRSSLLAFPLFLLFTYHIHYAHDSYTSANLNFGEKRENVNQRLRDTSFNLVQLNLINLTDLNNEELSSPRLYNLKICKNQMEFVYNMISRNPQ